MISGTVTVNVKRVFGRPTYYPHCGAAKLLCQMAGTRTMTHQQVLTLSQLGVKVVAVSQDADEFNAKGAS